MAVGERGWGLWFLRAAGAYRRGKSSFCLRDGNGRDVEMELLSLDGDGPSLGWVSERTLPAQGTSRRERVTVQAAQERHSLIITVLFQRKIKLYLSAPR